MKSKINFHLAGFANISLLQSCLKNHQFAIQLPDDKLLLSKVTQLRTLAPHSFQFTRDSTGNY